ncbi:MAG TPA: AraC family transcriptional regulator [Kofleriaceae bacterium]
MAEPVGRIEFAFPPELPGVRVLRGEGTTHLWRVLSDVYAISTPPSSAAEYRYRRRDHTFAAHTVGLFEPDEVFEITRMPFPETCRSLHIAPHVIETSARELGIRKGRVEFKHSLVRHQELFELTLQLHRALETHSSALERQSWFTRCVHHLLDDVVEVSAARLKVRWETAAVRKARELIDARFADDVSLDDLASACGMSRFHTLRSFSAAVGLPPHAYQTQLRVNQAMRLLGAGVSASAAASEVGFADQSHLHRHFKRINGITPGAFVRGARVRHA